MKDRAPPWLRGRTLAERATAATGARAAAVGPSTERRLERWRRDFPDGAALAERLALAGLHPDRLAGVLSGPSATGEAAEADWWQWGEDGFAPGTRSPVGHHDVVTDAQVGTGCMRLVGPLVRNARDRLAAHAATLTGERRADGPPFAADAIAVELARGIALELAGLCVPAVTLELGAARASGSLPGGEGPQRAAAFLRDLGRARRGRELFAEHPALLRLLYERCRLGQRAGEELLTRLVADWPTLVDGLLGGRHPGRLTTVQPLGDAHDGGRRVSLLEFGEGARLVYKPRPMAGDAAYQGLLTWLGGAGFEPAFREVACVALGDSHGWQEWVAPGNCGSRSGAERYYRRLGGQLAVLHALRATDLHHENLIASGEHPVAVDLECLFHPRLGGARAAAVDPLIAETSMDCVLRVGLLPRADVVFGVDISGLGRDPSVAVSIQEPSLLDDGSDGARLGLQSIELRPGANAATLDGHPLRPHEHVEALAEGFAAAHRLLRRGSDRLLAPGGALAAFAGTSVRAVLRPTKAYADLLARQVSEPAALDDGLAREEVLNALWRGVRRRPDLAGAVAAELHDLWHGDVPRFTTRPGSADLHHHAAGCLGGLLAPHAAEPVDCVARLGESDLERQLSFLRSSVVAAAANLPEPRHAVAPAKSAASERGLLDAARDAARRLDVLSLWEGDRAGWLGATAAPGHSGRVLRPLRPGLAAGQSGVALFLAALAVATDDERAEALAAGAVRQLLSLLAEGWPAADGVGLWAGAGGVLWTLSELAHSRADESLLDCASELARRRLPDARREERLGVGPGLAGWAIGLAAVGRQLSDRRLLEEAEWCAERLTEARDAESAGVLEGCAGRGLALLRLGDALGQPAHTATGEALVRRAGHTVWTDGSWADGSAGAVTAVAELVRRHRRGADCATATATDDGKALRAAAVATRRLGLGRDHTLATGDLGALCALRLAALEIEDGTDAGEAEKLAAGVLAEPREALLGAGGGGVEEPGLFTGTAGFGWAWLEFAGACPPRVLTAG